MYINVIDYGADPTGVQDSTQAFNKASEEAYNQQKILLASGTFLLTNTVNIYNSCEFSTSTFILKEKGNVDICYHSGEVKSTTINESELNKENLTYLNTSFKNVFKDTNIITEYEDSRVKILSDSVYIYRNGDSSVESNAQKKSLTTVMNRYGRLSYSLMFDFTTASNVRIELKKLPNKRLVFNSPKFIFEGTSSSYLKIKRDFVDINNLVILRNNTYYENKPDFYTLVDCRDAYSLNFHNSHLPGIGITNDEPGVTPLVLYDILLSHCVKVCFMGITSNCGWKNIDMNYSRDITVKDSILYGFHGHFACADILIQNSVMNGRALLFGTGAEDSVITVKDCTFYNRTPIIIGLRYDYGELKGKLCVENIMVNVMATTSSSNLSLIYLQERTLNKNPQPKDILYGLPHEIILKDITIRCNKDVDLITFNSGDIYSKSANHLSAPKHIIIDNINIESVNGIAKFSYNFIPKDYAVQEATYVSIRNMNQKKSIQVNMGANDTQNKLHYNLSICNANVGLNIFGSDVSRASIINCNINSSLQLNSNLMFIIMDNCYVNIAKNFIFKQLNVIKGFIKVTNTMFDARLWSEVHYILDQYVHLSRNNVCINCSTKITETEYSRVYKENGTQAIIPKSGEPGNYFIVNNDEYKGVLFPGWQIDK